MADLIASFANNPLYPIGIFFSFCAAYAFLMFLWGLVDYVFAMGNEEEKMHGRTNMVWGTSWLIVLFAAWEIVRFVASWFGKDTGDNSLGLWLTAIIVPVWILWYLWQKITAPAAAGGGH